MGGLGGRAERVEDAECTGGIVLAEVGGGEKDGGVGGEDAVRVAVGEVIEQGVGVGGVAGPERSLRAEEVGVVAEGVTAAAGGGVEGVDGVGVAMVEGVGVSDGEPRGRGGFAGVRGGVDLHAGVGGRGSCGGELLGHGPELGGGDEGLRELDGAGGGRDVDAAGAGVGCFAGAAAGVGGFRAGGGRASGLRGGLCRGGLLRRGVGGFLGGVVLWDAVAALRCCELHEEEEQKERTSKGPAIELGT